MLWTAQRVYKGRQKIRVQSGSNNSSSALLAAPKLAVGAVYFQLAFTAVTRVQIPSGTPNLINGLEEIVLFPAGTKRHKFHPNSAALLRNHQCFRGCRAYSYRHKKAQLKTAPSAADSVCANQTDYITLRLALVKCDCLGVSVQSDAARRVPEQFLHHFDIRPRCPQQ
jgi:hypothetical protein